MTWSLYFKAAWYARRSWLLSDRTKRRRPEVSTARNTAKPIWSSLPVIDATAALNLQEAHVEH
jgi:hypothetical protein